jgi:thiamine-monophosphate kinase
MALATLQGRYSLAEDELDACLPALHTPQPRVQLGLVLSVFAHSAIDISDGLMADLGHILQSSNVGADISLQYIPCSKVVSSRLTEEQVQKMVLTGGDDYELCFTAPARNHGEIIKLSNMFALPLTQIGVITTEPGLFVRGLDNEIINIEGSGFDHFSNSKHA